MKTKFQIYKVCLGQLAMLCFMTLCVVSQQLAYAEEDREIAKNFTLKSHLENNIKLSELRGQVVMLNFWASWCGTCIKQFSILDNLQKRYTNKGFTVLAVNIEQGTAKASNIALKRNLSFPVLFDTFSHVSRDYSVSTIPISYLIDRDGFIRHSLNATKVNNQKKTLRLIEELLNE